MCDWWPCAVSCLRLRVRGLLTDAEDDELRRLDHREPDLADEPTVIEIRLRHGAAVAADEERLVGRVAEQGTRAPLGIEEVGHRGAEPRPQLLAVGLEHDPL